MIPQSIITAISDGPIFSTNFEIGPINKNRIPYPMRTPMQDDPKAIPKAVLCCPFRDIGYPSNDVAIDEDVPGIFIRIAGILPPKLPPVKMEVRNSMACMKFIYRVAGRKIAIAMDICNPGTAPNNNPIRIPGMMMSQ